jgi:predicted esterase
MNAMLKCLIAATALVSGLSAAAFAQDAPKTAEDCFKVSIDLAKSAEDKKLDDAKLAKIEELLTKMEGQCEAQKFAEAAATSTEIKTAIGN